MLMRSSCQWFVANPVRLSGVLALALLEILDIFLVVAFEPDHLRVALEGKYVGCDAVEKPSIVAR